MSERPSPIQTKALSTFHGNTLTVHELEAASRARYDLGPGYPQLDVATYVKDLYLDDTIEDLSLRFAPFWTPEKQAQVDDDLEAAMRQFLSIARHAASRARATFSGSVALDRVIAAVSARARRSHAREGIAVITTTPSIDVMRLFLEERADVVPHFVESRAGGFTGALDVEQLTSTIRSVSRRGTQAVAVLLSSPENPTGATWSSDELIEVVSTCAEADATLVIDHCFAVAGVHHAPDLIRVWDLPQIECEWIAVWDTGKTFGLNEDKLGFILCGTDEMARYVDESLAVIQFGVSRRQKMFFTELMRRGYYYDHIATLRDNCRQNRATAMDLAPDLLARPPDAGSLLLIDLTDTGWEDEPLRKALLDGGVGTVAGNVFFHGQWRPTSLLRIALARDPNYFADAFTRMMRVVRQAP